MNVVDLADEQPDQRSVMPNAEETPSVNFPQEKYSVTYYAGLYTPLLEKQYFAWADDGKRHDSFCIVCLKSINSSKDAHRCGTCSRTYHRQCLPGVECALCFKRLWDDEPPFRQTAGILGRNDDSQVRLWRRHMKWKERMKAKEYTDFSRWVTFYDNGSLTSDRFLLKLMEITPANKFKGLEALKEQAGNTEVYRQYKISQRIRHFEAEMSARTNGLKEFRSKWKSPAADPYFEAQEDSLTALQNAIEYTRSLNSLEAPDVPQSKTQRLKEAESLIKKLKKDLAKARTQANDTFPRPSARVEGSKALPKEPVLDEKDFISNDKVISILSLSLETPANRPTTLAGLVAQAGVSEPHVQHLMQSQPFKEMHEKYKKKSQAGGKHTPETVRTPPLELSNCAEPATAPSSCATKRRTRAEAARDDARALNKERSE